MVSFNNVSVPPLTYTPPPSVLPVLPELVELLMASVPVVIAMAPPLSALLPVKVIAFKVMMPLPVLRKPPPLLPLTTAPVTVRFAIVGLPPVTSNTRLPPPLIVIAWLAGPVIDSVLVTVRELPSVIVCGPAARLKVIVPVAGQELAMA